MQVQFDLRASGGPGGLRHKFRLCDFGGEGIFRLDIGIGLDVVQVTLKKEALDDLVLELTENFWKRQEAAAKKEVEALVEELKRKGVDPTEIIKTLGAMTVAPIAQPVERTPEETKPAIDPGPGYRLLGYGETIRDGDEYRGAGSGWAPCCRIGKRPFPEFYYRRKLPAPPITRPATAE